MVLRDTHVPILKTPADQITREVTVTWCYGFTFKAPTHPSMRLPNKVCATLDTTKPSDH